MKWEQIICSYIFLYHTCCILNISLMIFYMSTYCICLSNMSKLQTFQPERREERKICQLGGLGDFRQSERLHVTIGMLDEESPDNNHTRFWQASAINAIFISRTLKLFRKILMASAISITILFPAFWTNRSAWKNSFFHPRSQNACFDQQGQIKQAETCL